MKRDTYTLERLIEDMRQRRRTLYDMRTEIADGRVRAIVDAIGEDDRFINGLDSTLTVAAAAWVV